MKYSYQWIGVLPLLCLFQLAHADAVSDFKAEMQRMEARHKQEMNAMRARLSTLETQKKQIERADDALKSDVVLVKEEQRGILKTLQDRVDVNLYGTAQYENFKHTTPTIDALNIELLASGRVSDRLKIFTEIEFKRNATTKAGNRQGEIEVERAYLEYAINEYFNPRFGAIFVPFGQYNLNHFQPFFEAIQSPIVMRRVIPSNWAEAGAGFVGSAPIGDKLKLTWLKQLFVDYQLFWVNGLTDELTDTGTRDARGAFGHDNNRNKASVGRANFTFVPGVEVGLSGYLGKYDPSNKHSIRGYDFDWRFTKDPVTFLGEYARFNLARGGFEKDGVTAVPDFLQGSYAQLHYRFWPAILNDTFLGRRFNKPTFVAVLGYGQAHIADDGDANVGSNKERRWSIGLNYRPVESWAFKLEYQWNRATNEPLERGNNNGFMASVSGAV